MNCLAQTCASQASQVSSHPGPGRADVSVSCVVYTRYQAQVECLPNATVLIQKVHPFHEGFYTWRGYRVHAQCLSSAPDNRRGISRGRYVYAPMFCESTNQVQLCNEAQLKFDQSGCMSDKEGTGLANMIFNHGATCRNCFARNISLSTMIPCTEVNLGRSVGGNASLPVVLIDDYIYKSATSAASVSS